MITILIKINGQSSMIPPKDTETENKREDPGSELITYALDSNKATFLIDINKQVHKNGNKLIINIKDITCEMRSQVNKLENKEEYQIGNRNAPDTDIPTEKQIQSQTTQIYNQYLRY
jgi:hypothetical protein